MLRILVISLVVANLLLLAFQTNKPVDPPKVTATRAEKRTTDIPTIHLFSEMMEDQGLLSSNRQCFTLGPFHSSEDKDDVRTRLLEVSTHISERQTEALVEKGYWVFMPPYASLLEANQALLSLQALGLEDIAIIYEGDWKSAISMGYFLRQENAQRRKKDLEDRGFDAKMRIQRQAEPRYWLDYEQSPGSGLIALDMQSRPNDFMQRPVPCPEGDIAEETGGVSQPPEQDLPVVAEAVSDSPEQDKPEDTDAATQAPEKAKPEDTVTELASDSLEQDKPEDTGAATQAPEKAKPEDAVTEVASDSPEQAKPEDTTVTSQAPAEYLPRPQATGEDGGTDSGQGEEAGTAEDIDDAPVESVDDGTGEG